MTHTDNCRTPHTIHIVILGQTSVGKSTFLNALLGARVSRTSIQRTTMSAHFYTEDASLATLDTHAHEPTAAPSSPTRTMCHFHRIPELDKLHTVLPLTLVDTPGLDDGECSAEYRTYTKDVLGQMARVYILMVDIHEAFNTSSSRETLQLICDIATQHATLPYKLLVVVNKCDGMKWNKLPGATAFTMEDTERADMYAQIEAVVTETTTPCNNLTCKIVPVSLADASVYRQLKLHPALELPENDLDRIGREELGKRAWQHKTTADKRDWFNTSFQSEDYAERMHETGFTHLCNTLNEWMDTDSISQWVVHDAMQVLEDDARAYPIREVLRTDTYSWLDTLCHQIDECLVLLHQHFPTHEAIHTYTEKALSVLNTRLCQPYDADLPGSSNTNLTQSTNVLNSIDKLRTSQVLSTHTQSLLSLAKKHAIDKHTQELKDEMTSCFTDIPHTHPIRPQLLPVCHWMCKWNDAHTCSHFLRECTFNLEGSAEDASFLKLVVQLHRLRIDTPLLLSWMEQYVLYGVQSHRHTVHNHNGYAIRVHVYLQTFCVNRLRTSPFLQLLLCNCIQCNTQRSPIYSGDKSTPYTAFELTSDMEVLQFYLQLSQPNDDTNKETEDDTFYDSSNSDKCTEDDTFYDSSDSDKCTEDDTVATDALVLLKRTPTVVSTDGSVYTGDLKDGPTYGVKHGHGTLTFNDGETYTGQWVDDQMCGSGVYTDALEDTYDGQWKYNMRHGHGIHTYDAKCETYEGQWAYDKIDGTGKVMIKDAPAGAVQRTFEGQWKDGAPCGGRGTYTDADGKSYAGMWGTNGSDEGWFHYEQTKYIDRNGNVYDGLWKDGQKHTVEHRETIDKDTQFPSSATDADVIRVAKKWNSSVQTICLKSCRHITDTAIVALAEHCPNLQNINLYGCKHITDTAIVALAEHCPILHTIRLNHCNQFTDTAIVALAEHCPDIHTIDLYGCHKITIEGKARLKANGVAVL